MLRIRQLRVESKGATICRVDDLQVERGEHVNIVGPNGSGKTTLLRVVAGLDTNYEGDVNCESSLRERVFVHQAPYLFRGSVSYNVGYPLAARGIARAQRRKTVAHWLEVFQVQWLAQRDCAQLSGGEQRRVALARAFAVDADLMLLDEPLAELDSVGIDAFCQAVQQRRETTVVSTSPALPPPGLESRIHFLSSA